MSHKNTPDAHRDRIAAAEKAGKTGAPPPPPAKKTEKVEPETEKPQKKK